ncbi:MAG: T9SS type A sorting domain-containing protein, partial [Chitinophagaceae bacterium]|nr:T9SS type A sorting domain-containing protein [Chitinophagaceae bacterium]
ATSSDICVGTNVTFTATGQNGGASPTYQWRLNGNNVGSNSATYSNSALSDKDNVYCLYTSNATCRTLNTIQSNIISTKVTQYETPTASVTSPSLGVACSGLPVDFKVSTTWAGNTPTYQWQVNGSPVGSNMDTYTSSNLSNGDDVKCVVTSSFKCPAPPIVNSNTIKMTVNQTKTADVRVVPNPDSNICDGQQITIYTYYVNGGTNPKFQWQLNGTDIPGATLPTLSISTLNDNDMVQCHLISNAICVFPETSPGVTFSVTPNVTPAVDVAISYSGANMYTFTASPVNGGASPKYEWYVNGLRQPGNSNVFTSDQLTQDDKVYVEMSSSLECVTNRIAGSRLVTTGVGEIKSEIVKELSLYPNPNTGQFIISGKLNTSLSNQDVVVKIMNATGQTVYNKAYSVGGDELNLDVKLEDAMANGMYMVNIIIDNNITHMRFMLNR